jgi:hypothetical protein
MLAIVLCEWGRVQDVIARIPFRLPDIRDFDGGPLLASEPGRSMLALLTRYDQSACCAASRTSFGNYLAGERRSRTAIRVSGLRSLEKTVARSLDMIGMIDIMENKVLGPAVLRGVHQGQIVMLTALWSGSGKRRTGSEVEAASERQLLAGDGVFLPPRP